jgi:hypothetical protein
MPIERRPVKPLEQRLAEKVSKLTIFQLARIIARLERRVSDINGLLEKMHPESRFRPPLLGRRSLLEAWLDAARDEAHDRQTAQARRYDERCGCYSRERVVEVVASSPHNCNNITGPSC